MTNEERRKAVEWYRNRAKNCPLPGARQMYEIAVEALEEPKVENMKGLTNAEWIDFLSEQFDISRTSARDMLHVMMSIKKEDSFKKQFNKPRATGKRG
jgi:hypothetical protein